MSSQNTITLYREKDAHVHEIEPDIWCCDGDFTAIEFWVVRWCTAHDCNASRANLNSKTCKWNVTYEHDPCVFVEKLIEV